MKIEINHLGVIENAVINLKPLTVFIGENGTGKTWTAYILAGILGSYGYQQYKQIYLEGKSDFECEQIENAIRLVIEKGNIKINLAELVEKYAEIYFNQIAKSVPNWINTFLSTRRANFDRMEISIELSEIFKEKMLNFLRDLRAQGELSLGVKKESALFTCNFLKEKDSDDLYYYTTANTKDIEELPQPIIDKEIRDFLISEIFKMLHKSAFSDIPIFPTERTTFISLAFPLLQEEDIKGYKKKKNSKVKSSELIMPSEPVKYLLTMIGSSLRLSSKRKKQEIQEPKISKFIELADFLEREILLGSLCFEEKGRQAELIYMPTKDANLELNISSSMIKELAPLALYLRYLAEPGDMLVIDEPEMNLHPVAQVEITEFLCMLINSGLNVLITTHSPYILDHLSNLIRAKECNKEEDEIKEFFYLERTDSFISKDKVAIYLFEDNTAKDILNESGDIDWGTFSNVSHDVSHIYSKLI